ncbi:MAG TPA: ABC transporter ATP-binding protein [Tepidisphaeraceae bacterium]|jgi:ABC-type multidrug transport system fused ATPase/permease subunit
MMDRATTSRVSQTAGTRFYCRILSYFRADWLLILLLIGIIWLALGLGALQPAAVALLTDKVLSGKPLNNFFSRLLVAILPEGRLAQIVALSVLWVALQVCNDLITLFREMINKQLFYNGTARIRQDLFDHYQMLGLDYHRSQPQGDSIYRLNIDTQGFFGVLDKFIGAANSVLTLFVVSAVMLTFNRTITYVILGLTPLLLLVNIHFSRMIRSRSLVAKAAESDLTTFTQRAMSAIGLIQLFGRQETESDAFRGAVNHTIRTGMRMTWQEQLYPFAQRVIFASGFAFVLGYGSYLALHSLPSYGPAYAGNGPSFTVGAILAMTFYLVQLWEPLKRITGFTADVQKDAAACARVFNILAIPRGPVDDTGPAVPLNVLPRTLELDDVYFEYEPGRPVLRGVSARIDPGSMVAFVGASGAGKSTLLNLLPRFYDPKKGTVRLGGYDLRALRVADVRKHIALVPQDSPVIVGSIAENIAFGCPHATMSQIRNAARLAGASEFIERLPQGYSTMLSESGQNLSGGQRQRLAIARALLTDAPILVLDEPTSGLDRRQEQWFVRTLRRLKGRRTIILVTHNLATVEDCDQIYFLHEGRVAEQGTHEDLLAYGGLYAALAAFPHRTTISADSSQAGSAA